MLQKNRAFAMLNICFFFDAKLTQCGRISLSFKSALGNSQSYKMTGAVANEPEYSIEEDNNFINLTIPAPLSRPDSAAIVLEKNVLTFDTPPYLLR